MSRMAIIAMVATLAVNTVNAGLCDLAPGDGVAGRSVDFLGDWRDDCLDSFHERSLTRAVPFWSSSSDWGAAGLRTRAHGADIDRWWYAYLDRGRYRFLDETQYTLLDGPAGLQWRWRYRAWLDAVNPSWSVPARAGRDTSQVIPEPGTAAFLVLGLLVVLRRHRHDFV